MAKWGHSTGLLPTGGAARTPPWLWQGSCHCFTPNLRAGAQQGSGGRALGRRLHTFPRCGMPAVGNNKADVTDLRLTSSLLLPKVPARDPKAQRDEENHQGEPDPKLCASLRSCEEEMGGTCSSLSLAALQGMQTQAASILYGSPSLIPGALEHISYVSDLKIPFMCLRLSGFYFLMFCLV